MFPRAAHLACVAAFLSAVLPATAQYTKLLADDGEADDAFGYSVAIAGGVAVVGAYMDDDSGPSSGSAYLFDVATGLQIGKLIAEDGEPGDGFGNVALAGGIAIVGAPYDSNENGQYAGSAYLFDISTGRQLAKLLPDDGTEYDAFGCSVAIAGGVAAVGAVSADRAAGAAYVFAVPGGQQLAKLLSDDREFGDQLGCSVAVADGLVLVGAQTNDGWGAAYVFDAATGRQLAKLCSDEPTGYFGHSVGIDAGVAIVGRCFTPDERAYLFDAVTGKQLAVLAADDRHADGLGCAVSIRGGVALVGAREDDDRAPQSGTAYLFDVATGRQLGKLVAGDGAQGDELGCAVALADDLALVGARYDDDRGLDAGAAYIFTYSACVPDLNEDRVVDTRDVIRFLDMWAWNNNSADWNRDGEIDQSDLFAYLEDWSEGC